MSHGRQNKFFKHALQLYFFMAVIGLVVMYYNQQLEVLMDINTDSLTNNLAYSFIVFIGILIIGKLAEMYSKGYKIQLKFFISVFGSFSILQLFLLAVFSGVAEELLFRGGLQPIVGIVFTSLIFGCLHLSPKGRPNLWTLLTVLSGFLLGGLQILTNSIVYPILVHFCINFFSMMRFKFIANKKLEGVLI